MGKSTRRNLPLASSRPAVNSSSTQRSSDHAKNFRSQTSRHVYGHQQRPCIGPSGRNKEQQNSYNLAPRDSTLYRLGPRHRPQKGEMLQNSHKWASQGFKVYQPKFKGRDGQTDQIYQQIAATHQERGRARKDGRGYIIGGHQKDHCRHGQGHEAQQGSYRRLPDEESSKPSMQGIQDRIPRKRQGYAPESKPPPPRHPRTFGKKLKIVRDEQILKPSRGYRLQCIDDDPQWIKGFYIENQSTSHYKQLPLHEIKQQYLPRSEAKKVCTNKIAVTDDADAQYSKVCHWQQGRPFAEVFFIKRDLLGEDFDRLVEELIATFSEYEELCKEATKAASGAYFEGGYGSGAGDHTTSIRCNSRNPGDKVLLTYARKSHFSRFIEEASRKVEQAIIRVAREVFPDHFPSSDRILENLGLRNKYAKAAFKALQFPFGSGLFPFSARAYRLVGCPENSSNWRSRVAAHGGATLHCDLQDPEFLNGGGMPMLYIPPSDKSRPLKAFNLAVFGSKVGGRGVEIETMHPDFICIVFINTRHPHGSIFPNECESFENPSVFAGKGQGLRLVCYTTKQTVKLAMRCANKANWALIFREWKAAIARLEKRVKDNPDGPGMHPGHSKAYHKVKLALTESC